MSFSNNCCKRKGDRSKQGYKRLRAYSPQASHPPPPPPSPSFKIHPIPSFRTEIEPPTPSPSPYHSSMKLLKPASPPHYDHDFDNSKPNIYLPHLPKPDLKNKSKTSTQSRSTSSPSPQASMKQISSSSLFCPSSVSIPPSPLPRSHLSPAPSCISASSANSVREVSSLAPISPASLRQSKRSLKHSHSSFESHSPYQMSLKHSSSSVQRDASTTD